MKSSEGFDYGGGTEDEDIENMENAEWRFSYYNRELPGRPLVFECTARSQAEADNKYEKVIGKSLSQSDHISRTYVRI